MADPESGCWLWQKSRGSHGYGQIGTGGARTELAHRVAFEVYHKEPSNFKVVMHSCDNRQCCNPEHLSEGTYTDNLNDALSKGRHSVPDTPDNRGSNHGMSKLTEEAVKRIYLDSRPRKEVANEFNVSVQTVSDIRGGKSWRHVTSTLKST